LPRHAIDGVDDALLAWLAGRGRLAGIAARSKRRAGLAPRDAAREARIHARAQRLARHLGVPTDAARALLEAAIGDGRARQEGDAGRGRGPAATRWLRLLPPPARLAPLARRVPGAWQGRVLEAAMARVLGAALAAGELDFLHGRALGIDVTDLDLHWVVGVRD